MADDDWQEERQAELMVGWAGLPRSPGHAFYDRPQAVLVEAGFDGFAEARAIVRRATPARATGRCCGGWRPAAASGTATPTAGDLVRPDRKRKGKRLSNTEWTSPSDPGARIAER